jgi:thiamine transport system permease protein
MALFGRNSTLNSLLMQLGDLERPPIRLERTLTLVLMAHVFYNYAVAVRIISGFWSHQDRKLQEAAAVLGANPLVIFGRITLPLLRPAISAAAVLVFTFTFTSFGVMRVLGGLQFATLEVEIYQQSTGLFNLPVAAALALVQLGITFTLMLIYTLLQRRMSQPTQLQAAQSAARRPHSWREWLWVGINVAVMVVLLIAPLAALVERSLAVRGAEGISWRHYTSLAEQPRRGVVFVRPVAAIENSLKYAAAATLFAVILGVLAAYLLERAQWRWLDPLFMLPLATSAVTLGFGFILALDEPPLNLRDSFWMIPIAHTLVAMPFVVRSMLPALRAIRPSLREAAAVLGAGAWGRWWRIDRPLLARSIAAGATFAFTISMGEFGAALFIARTDEPTIPIVIFRLLGRPGGLNYGQALAMSVLLMAVCAVGFLIIERLNRQILGEF